ncbi:MAG: LPS assembly lipoprotein LptE [Deltaproteobacteria bacterium]|nr:LPS assembly lipoprotein LptE [Deltaproteobacteria bacterium]
MKLARQGVLLLGVPLAVALLAGACGYRFVDSDAGLPEDVRTVYVEPFVNRTRVVGLEDGLALALRRELSAQARPRVGERPDDADAILSGVIRNYETRNVSVNRFDEVLQVEARFEVEATLRRRQSKEVLWPRQLLRLREVYHAARGAVVPGSSGFLGNTLDPGDVSQLADARLAEDSRARARKRLLERFARLIRQRMAEGF